jgi:hypothetical protein
MFVGRLVNVSLEDVPDVQLTVQVVEPHAAQLVGGDFALEVEEVVVAELAERGRVVFAPAAVGEIVPVLGAVDVGARPGRPEDGAHLLVAAAVVVAQPPGQRPRRRAVPYSQPLAYFGGAGLSVICILFTFVQKTKTNATFDIQMLDG